MPARFELLVNGEPVCLAGIAGETGVLEATLLHSTQTDHTGLFDFWLMSLNDDTGKVTPYSVRAVGPDDEILIRILPDGSFEEPDPHTPRHMSLHSGEPTFEKRRLAIQVNGERALVAGCSKAASIKAALTYVHSRQRNRGLHFSVESSLETGEHVSWQTPRLSIGDEVTFRTLPPDDDFDPPTYVRPAKVRE